MVRTRRSSNAKIGICDAPFLKHYERWATANGFPRENIINDGTTANTGGVGAVADFDLALRCKGELNERKVNVRTDVVLSIR